MKPLLLFDVDGTIAQSGQKISDKIIELFTYLSTYYDLGIVGGGKYEKIVDQIHDSKLFTHIFAECGCVYYKLNQNQPTPSYDLMYEKNIRLHPLYIKINQWQIIILEHLNIQKQEEI